MSSNVLFDQESETTIYSNYNDKKQRQAVNLYKTWSFVKIYINGHDYQQ